MEEVLGAVTDTAQRKAAAEAHLARIADEFFAVSNAPEWAAHCELRVDLADKSPLTPMQNS